MEPQETRGMDGVTFSEKLITLRGGRGWTQGQLAEKLGVTRQTVSNWERALSLPDAVGLTALSRVFNVDAEWLPDESADSCPKPRRMDFLRRDWVVFVCAILFFLLCPLLTDAVGKYRAEHYAMPWYGWLVNLLRYLRWIALGWCAALLVRMAFLLSAGRKARIAVGAAALAFLALAAAIILCVRYAAVESRTLSLIVYYLMMNNWLFILPGAALGFAVSFRPPLGD